MGKMMAACLVLVFLVSSQMLCVQPSAFDCMDACTTACVQRDLRLMSRCERKCQIRCDPDLAVDAVDGQAFTASNND